MGDKKHLGRFTVQFNLGDPQQARVSEILEHQGRQKARFISTAILHYINCKETPEVTLPPVPDAAEIEKIVLAILKKHTSEDYTHPMPPSRKFPPRNQPVCRKKCLLPQSMRTLLMNSRHYWAMEGFLQSPTRWHLLAEHKREA